VTARINQFADLAVYAVAVSEGIVLGVGIVGMITQDMTVLNAVGGAIGAVVAVLIARRYVSQRRS